MAEEERRRSYDTNWEEIKNFINESREYRAADEVKQDYQIKSVDALNEKVKIQNGRIFKLEEWKNQLENTAKNKKDSKGDFQAYMLTIATVIMALSAIVVLFKK